MLEMLSNFPVDYAMFTLLVVLVCATIFLGNVHLSTLRLCLLMLITMVICSLVPAARSTLGPGPASDAQGNLIKGADGKPLYDRKAVDGWSRATTAEDAILIFGGLVGGISAILLLLRGYQAYRDKLDS